MGKKIPQEKINEIMRLYRLGVPYKDISKQVDVGISTVNVYIQKLKNYQSIGNDNVYEEIMLENEKLKEENSKLYELVEYTDYKICCYKDLVSVLRSRLGEPHDR